MTFTVEPDALEKLSSELRQLDESTGYGNVCMANDARSYHLRHIKVSRPSDVGMLFLQVYSETEDLRVTIGESLEKTSDVLEGSATELSAAAARYNELDEEGRAQMDAAYPGNGTGESYDLAVGCPMSPLMALTEPTEIFPTDWVSKIITNDWLSPSATVASLIDLVFDWNPIDEVSKVFSGDWDDMERIGSACEILGNYFGSLTSAAQMEAGNCMQAWSGEAADSAASWFKKFDEFGNEIEGKFDELKTQYGTVALSMSSFGSTLSGLLAQIMDSLIYAALLSAAAVVTAKTVVGGIVFGALAIFRALQVASLIKYAYSVIQQARTFIDLFVGTTALITSWISSRTLEITIPGAYDHAQVSS